MIRSHRAPKSKRRALAALIAAALVLATGAVSLSLATRPTQLATAPADIVLPAGLSGDDLHQWCVDRKAAGTTGLTSNAKNWLNGCIEVSKPIPSPSPTSPSPSPTASSPSPTPTTPCPTPTTPSPSPTTTAPSPSPSPTTTGPVLTGCVAHPGACGYPDAVSAG